ncbi:MAG: RNA 2',3'-cyclic phosphodiesterase [Spirochaetaceae bacterium]|nr:MAG: RNA 2',3'-cyclic phosphodiesterase [Spirochaetaceae bacterium]
MQIDAFRWIKARNTHLTLHFLGDLPASKIEDIDKAIKSGITAAASTQQAESDGPIRCQLGGLGFFPDKQRPRVVWIGLNELQTKKNTGLQARGSALFSELDRALCQEGISSQSKAYNPHITLGYRLRNVNDAQATTVTSLWQKEIRQSPLIFPLTQFALYESLLSPKGRVHKPLKEYKL